MQCSTSHVSFEKCQTGPCTQPGGAGFPPPAARAVSRHVNAVAVNGNPPGSRRPSPARCQYATAPEPLPDKSPCPQASRSRGAHGRPTWPARGPSLLNPPHPPPPALTLSQFTPASLSAPLLSNGHILPRNTHPAPPRRSFQGIGTE